MMRCRSCDLTVIPLKDGRCPSCRKPLAGNAEPAGLAERGCWIRARESSALLDICFHCASRDAGYKLCFRARRDGRRFIGGTQEITEVEVAETEVRRQIQTADSARRVLSVLLRILHVPYFWVLRRKETEDELDHFTVVLPACKACFDKRKDFQIGRVEFEDRAMTIQVHEDYASAFYALLKPGS